MVSFHWQKVKRSLQIRKMPVIASTQVSESLAVALPHSPGGSGNREGRQSLPMSTRTDFHFSVTVEVWPCKTFATCCYCARSAAVVVTVPYERALKGSVTADSPLGRLQSHSSETLSVWTGGQVRWGEKKMEQEKGSELKLCYWPASCYVTPVATETSEWKKKHEWERKTKQHRVPHD